MPLMDNDFNAYVNAYQNTPIEIEVEVLDTDGAAVNLSAWTNLKFRAKSSLTSSTYLLDKTASFTTDGSDGKVKVSLSANDLPNNTKGTQGHYAEFSAAEGIVAHLMLKVLPVVHN